MWQINNILLLVVVCQFLSHAKLRAWLEVVAIDTQTIQYYSMSRIVEFMIFQIKEDTITNGEGFRIH